MESELRRIDMTGQRFGRLIVTEYAGCRDGKRAAWRATCDCGALVTVLRDSLIAGRTASCGCYARARVTTHGMTGSPEYRAWDSMVRRCHSPGTTNYRKYGARGISVCDSWHRSFAAFFADMGPRPTPLHSLDRIDSNRGYEPGNCRWATIETQNRNRRSVKRITHCGESLTVPEWAARTGLTTNCIYIRIKNGWPAARALTEGAMPMIYVTVSGRLTKDAELKSVGQSSVCNFSVASNGKSSHGEKVTTFVDCGLWGKRGAALAQHLLKGTAVSLAGKLSTREHNGRTYLQCDVHELEFMGGGKRDDKPATDRGDAYEPPADDGDIPF